MSTRVRSSSTFAVATVVELRLSEGRRERAASQQRADPGHNPRCARRVARRAKHGTPALDDVVDALGRARARAWARLRSACPDLPEAEIDFAADKTVDVIASVPVLVVLLVIADAARCADAGGAS